MTRIRSCARELLRERGVVVGPVARREDCEGDRIETLLARRNLSSIDPRDFSGWVTKRTAAKCAQDGVSDSMGGERVQLGCNSSTRVFLVELGTIAKILGRCTKLEEGEHLIVRQPVVSKVGSRPILGSADTDPGLILIQVDLSVPRRQKPRHLWDIAVPSRVVLLVPYLKVAVGASEDVLFLCGGTFDIRAPGT